MTVCTNATKICEMVCHSSEYFRIYIIKITIFYEKYTIRNKIYSIFIIYRKSIIILTSLLKCRHV